MAATSTASRPLFAVRFGVTRRARAGGAALIIALGGCSSADGDARQVEQERAGTGILDSARGDDLVDGEQLAVLETGEVDFAAYEAAVGRTVSCMRQAGIDVVGTDPVETKGFPEILYSYAASSPGRTDAQTDEVAQACIRRHSMYIEAAYANSPAVREALFAQFDVKKDLIIDCLTGLGFDVDEDATADELNELIVSGMEQGAGSCLPQFVDE